MIDWERVMSGEERREAVGRKRRKRGGLAGLWDRNKGAIGSVAGGLAGSFIPGLGPMLGGALGSALGGAAGRGKFEGGRAIGDALSGGAIGGLRGSFMPTLGEGASRLAKTADKMNSVISGALDGGAAPAAAPSLSSRLASGLGKAGSYLRDNPEFAAMATQGALGAMQSGAQRDLARDQMAEQKRQFDATMAMRNREYEDEQARQRRIAELLSPLFSDINSRRGPMATPGAPMMGGY